MRQNKGNQNAEECHLKLEVEDMVLPYKIIRTDRKTLAISVDKKASILVRAPIRLKQKEIEKIVFDHKSKIHTQYMRALKRTNVKPIISIGSSETIPLYNKNFPIHMYETNGKECIKEDGKRVEIWVQSSKEGYQDRAGVLLEKWYRRKGREIFEERVSFFAKKMGTTYNRIFVKDQKTCWGSCSNHKNLNFNWRLLMMPSDILDYCVVHELAHTKEMNHSKDFWALVSKEFPLYKEHRKFLKENVEKFRIE